MGKEGARRLPDSWLAAVGRCRAVPNRPAQGKSGKDGFQSTATMATVGNPQFEGQNERSHSTLDMLLF
jgi:hypothetical protein